jgi:hypothetical protein
LAEKLAVVAKRNGGGLEARMILRAFRGAEAPLFHGTARIWEPFWSL